MKSLSAVFILSIFCHTAYTQPQINNWFFSGNNGINFSSGSPVNISGGQIIVMEGTSAPSVSSK
jgi:hypothetical protein